MVVPSLPIGLAQVHRGWSALEQAPDQIASRPFVTLNVTDVPVSKEADPVLPTLTLMPAGLDVTCSPAAS